MKILLTGGGTGGHFYPVIAVAQEINEIVKENRLLRPDIYFMSTNPYNEGLLFQNNIVFEKVSSGKVRNGSGFSNRLANFFDYFKTVIGCTHALWRLFVIYPDVVFGKGGYASFPAIFAARLLKIPVIIHESDSTPGKVNKWAKNFARRIAISYPEAVNFFPKEKTAYTGNPVRKDIQDPMKHSDGAELLGMSADIPTILILGGSQGSRFINEVIMDTVAELVKKYQVIHQTGKNNIRIIEETSEVVLNGQEHKDRYKAFEYLDTLHLRAAVGLADIIISRAGSTIFEIAVWGKPSIIIPIPEPTSHDQRTNAYAYARSGSCVVIEEKNLASGLFISEIQRIIDSEGEKEKMHKSTLAFARKDSAVLIAREIIALALEHDK